jgi:hypothetical protein
VIHISRQKEHREIASKADRILGSVVISIGLLILVVAIAMLVDTVVYDLGVLSTSPPEIRVIPYAMWTIAIVGACISIWWGREIWLGKKFR